MPRISIELFIEVERLAAAGRLTHRAIARKTGVARHIVSLIAAGRYDPIAPPRRVEKTDHPYPRPDAPFVWCPACRAKVRDPCYRCYVRNWKPT